MIAFVYRLSQWAAIIGGLALVALTLMIVASVSGRAMLGLGLGPVPGDFELVEVGTAIAVPQPKEAPKAATKVAPVAVDIPQEVPAETGPDLVQSDNVSISPELESKDKKPEKPKAVVDEEEEVKPVRKTPEPLGPKVGKILVIQQEKIEKASASKSPKNTSEKYEFPPKEMLNEPAKGSKAEPEDFRKRAADLIDTLRQFKVDCVPVDPANGVDVGIQQDHHRCVVGQKGVGHAHRQALAGIDDQPPAGGGLLRQVEVVAFYVQRIARRTGKAPVHHGPLFVGGQPAQQIEGIGAGGGVGEDVADDEGGGGVDDLARRLASPLTPAERAHLDAYGYPYVGDAFRFHMTLTGPVESTSMPTPLLAVIRPSETTMTVLLPVVALISMRPPRVRSLSRALVAGASISLT